MGRGPARSIKFLEDGPRPGPAHHISNKSRPGPTRPIFFSNILACPGSAHHMAAMPRRHGFYMGRADNYVGRPVDLTGRPMGRSMCCPVLKGAGAYADAIFSR